MRLRFWQVIYSSWIVCSGCSSFFIELGEPARALRMTPEGEGPEVIYDFYADPLPEIPLPNDDAMRYDPSSPTKARINVSFRATTAVERRAREAFNQLDGFGTYAPITVSFDAPIDVIDLWERHNTHDPASGRYRDDFRDDALFLLNVDEGCDRYGEEVALDMGRGRFPATMYKHIKGDIDPEAPDGRTFKFSSLFHFSIFDPHATANNILFEEWNEDQNKNGILDLGEDRDGDGHLDIANLLHPEACDGFDLGTVERNRCVADELMTFYDRQSDTLILRPVWPLEQRCRYAVVLTDRLKGVNGEPIKSPFKGVNPTGQTPALEPLTDLLPRYGLGLENVSFAWSFITGTTTKDMEALRAGLYGHGPFLELADRFAPERALHIWSRGELDVNDELPEDVREDTFLPGACVGLGLVKYWVLSGEWAANLCAIERDSSAMDKVFGGTFKAPDLLIDRDDSPPPTDRYPQTSDERWEVEAHTGTLKYGETEVTFWCSLPQELEQDCEEGNPEGRAFCKPFPTLLYAHGYGGSRAEVITGHIGRANAMGYALCALDAYGHGLNILIEDNPFAQEASLLFILLNQFGVPDYKQLLMRGRDRDLDNDGMPDSGADMWTSDIFHTKDMVRQTSLEHIQFVRILRSFDGIRRDDRGHILGDIDGDDAVDLGGPVAPIGMWGISLGGIISGVVAGAEPALDAVSPNAGGAGLVDIAVRSSQTGVPQAVLLPVIGPFLIGCLPSDDHQTPLSEGEEKSCFKRATYDPETGELNEERSTLKANEMELAFLLNDNASQNELPFARLQGVEVGDWIELENLDNGEVKRRRVGPRGTLMISVAADALTAPERRGVLGFSDDDTTPKTVQDLTLLGDRLIVRHFKGSRAPTGSQDTTRRLDLKPEGIIDRFQYTIEFQGTYYPKDATLVALQEGLGIDRNTPRFRRFMGLAQAALGPGDPGVWSAHIYLEPLSVPYATNGDHGGNTRVLQMPTVGDQQVPVNTGIAAARVTGLFGSWLRDEERYPDPRYGWRALFQPTPRYPVERDGSIEADTIDQLLIDRYVVEGDPKMRRYDEASTEPFISYATNGEELIHEYALFDIDNISDGVARFSCSDEDWSAKNGEYICSDEWRERGQTFPIPYDPQGLRVTIERGDRGRYDAFRVPLLRPAGQHGIYNSQPFRVFDADAFMVNFTTRFLGSGGRLVDHPTGCDCNAESINQFTFQGSPYFPAKPEGCETLDQRLCEASCAEAWGFRALEPAMCSVP